MLKYCTVLIITIIFIAQFGCKFGKEAEEKDIAKEFEGVITYHEIDWMSDGTVNVDDTVKLYYAHGNYVAFHSQKTAKFHIVKDYYLNAPIPLRLFVDNTSDTLRSLRLDTALGKLESFKVKKLHEQILSRNCESIELKISFNENGAMKYTDNTFIFSRGYLKINKEHFKNWRLGFFNKVIDESGAYYLKFKAVHFDSSHKKVLAIKSYDVIAVKEEQVDPKMFFIDPSKIR